MEITFDREKLLDAVNLLKGITRTANKIMPVTRCVRFEVLSGKAELSANDLEVAAVTSISCKSDNSGQSKVFCIHGGTLAEILASIKGQEIVMTLPDIVAYGDSKAVIKKDRIEVGLPLVDPDDFPEIAPLSVEDETFTVNAADFIDAVTRTFYASSNDEQRYVLTGLNMQLIKGTFCVIGTDGFRLALSRRNIAEGGTSPDLVVPARVAKFMKDTIPEHAEIEVTLEAKRARFSTNLITIVSRIIAENYPDYEGALGTPAKGVCFLKRVDLLEALKRTTALATKGDAVMIRRSRDGLRLDAETQCGTYKETIDCTYRDETPLALNVSIKFLLDAVEHLTVEELAIQYPPAYGMIRIDEGTGPVPDYTVGIMPIRNDVPPLKEDNL
jgi:DNA polymerase III subunit beta